MHCTKCLASIVCAVLLFLGLPARGEEISKVIPENAAIHSQPSAKASITGSLERGHRVVIDLMLTDSGGSWCLVREPERKGPVGYVLCNQLTHEAPPQIYPPLRAVSPSTQEMSRQGANPDDASAGVANNGPELGALERWAVQLDLTAEQRNTVMQLFDSSGLAACREDLAATYQRYGVTDSYSLVKRSSQYSKAPFSDSFAAAVEPKLQRCGKRYKSFWQSFWNTLTPEQHEKAAHIPSFFFAYLGSQSDPETAFGGSVLQGMRSSRRAK